MSLEDSSGEVLDLPEDLATTKTTTRGTTVTDLPMHGCRVIRAEEPGAPSLPPGHLPYVLCVFTEALVGSSLDGSMPAFGKYRRDRSTLKILRTPLNFRLLTGCSRARDAELPPLRVSEEPHGRHFKGLHLGNSCYLQIMRPPLI